MAPLVALAYELDSSRFHDTDTCSGSPTIRRANYKAAERKKGDRRLSQAMWSDLCGQAMWDSLDCDQCSSSGDTVTMVPSR